MKKYVLYGPPGTGKTRSGIDLATLWLRGGVGSGDIAYLAFTRAAAREAAGRILGAVNHDAPVYNRKEIEEEFPFFRTIHSLCFRLMGFGEDRGEVITTSAMKKFADQSHMEGAYAVNNWEDLADVFMAMEDFGKTSWDRIAAAYNLSRLACRNVAELEAVRKRVHPRVVMMTRRSVHEDQYAAWISQYEAYKKREHRIDFTDMLEYSLRSIPPIPVKRLIVDEAQDLAPLHWAIMEKLFYPVVEECWLIGDEDQSIFGFSCASAEEFLRQARDAIELLLHQTHRFGQNLVDYAEQIIRRVRHRIKKEIKGVPGRQNRIDQVGSFAPFYGPAFILHRHVMGCQAIASKYIDAGIPFSNERGKSPLNATQRIRAYETLDALAKGKQVEMARIIPALVELVPTMHEEEDRVLKFLPRGAKKRLQDRKHSEAMTTESLLKHKYILPDFVSVMKSRNWDFFKHADDLAYYERLRRNNWDLTDNGAPIITTIHGSKGREREHVVVFSETSRRCWDHPDDEHRLAYVAATRAKHELTICGDRLVDWANVRYDYPACG
jgi:superfamily I DNA/RNA helicase